MSPANHPPIFELTRCADPDCSPACGQCLGTRQAWRCTACGKHWRYVEGCPPPPSCYHCDEARAVTDAD